MNKYEQIFESLQNKLDSGELTEEAANTLNDIAYDVYVSESFLKSPLKNKLERLKEIKDAKPGEYDGEEEVKKFVDKHYDEIAKASEELQNEPEKLSKDERNYIINVILSFVVYLGSACTLCLPVMIISLLYMIISSYTWMIVRNARVDADTRAMKDLSKVKTALKKLDNKKLPDEYKKKISKLIQDIDDAETDIYAKFKKVSESVDDYNMIASYIQESLDNGDLTEEEANEWNDTAFAILSEEASTEEDSVSLEEVMDFIDDVLTEKCGAIDAVKSAGKSVGKVASNAGNEVGKVAKKSFTKAKNFAGDTKALKDIYKDEGEEALTLTNNKAKKAFAVAGANAEKAAESVGKKANSVKKKLTSPGDPLKDLHKMKDNLSDKEKALLDKLEQDKKKGKKTISHAFTQNKVTKESVDEMRLRVYEAHTEGAISDAERDVYLEYLSM